MSKAIDKAAGVEGTLGAPKSEAHAGWIERGRMRGEEGHDGYQRPWMRDEEAVDRNARQYVPGSSEAEQWQGWGTALKPAHEPIVVARKPLIGTVAANVLEHGTGAVNVDACRIGFAGERDEREAKEKNQHERFGSKPRDNNVLGDMSQNPPDDYDAPGRWPANVILLHLDGCVRVGARRVRTGAPYERTREATSGIYGEGATTKAEGDNPRPYADEDGTEEIPAWECEPGCPVAELDAQSGKTRDGVASGRSRGFAKDRYVYGEIGSGYDGEPIGYGGEGGASRFFYTAKVSRAERNAGLDGFDKRALNWSSGEQSPGTFQAEGTERAARNHHPTVKPIALMRWLIRLVCPPDGVILDPFLGSGSTGCAAVLEDCVGRFVGIERDPDYIRIAEARIAFWQEHGEDGLRIVAEREAGERRRREVEDAGQLDIFAS